MLPDSSQSRTRSEAAWEEAWAEHELELQRIVLVGREGIPDGTTALDVYQRPDKYSAQYRAAVKSAKARHFTKGKVIDPIKHGDLEIAFVLHKNLNTDQLRLSDHDRNDGHEGNLTPGKSCTLHFTEDLDITSYVLFGRKPVRDALYVATVRDLDEIGIEVQYAPVDGNELHAQIRPRGKRDSDGSMDLDTRRSLVAVLSSRKLCHATENGVIVPAMPLPATSDLGSSRRCRPPMAGK